MEKRGKFIVVEGFDGAGKSTFCETLKLALEAQGHHVVVCRQPGGTPLAEEIRSIHKRTNHDEPVTLLTEYLLMSAARHQLWSARIAPALEAGSIVISDRHTLSSYAYQGMLLPEVETAVSGKPDLTIWLNVDYDVAMARLAVKNEACRIEQKGDDFLQQVHERYEIAYDELPVHDRIAVNSNDFDSLQYEDDCRSALLLAIRVCDATQITAREFEDQVYRIEGVRVIIRQDSNLTLPAYIYYPLSDDDPVSRLDDRLRHHLRGVSYVLPVSKVNEPIKSGFNRSDSGLLLGQIRRHK